MSTHTITTFRYDTGTGSFYKKTTERKLGPNEIKVNVTHSGICYTDVHAKHKGCGLGHEGVGIVVEVGDAVKSLKFGTRVGWGWLRSSCGNCASCLDGYRQYCADAAGFAFCDTEQGAFADTHIIDASFAYEIPPNMDSVHAAVFQCAGASTFEALQAANTKSHHRVGVVGLGGLGHMAVLFAKAMGCAVTVISNSEHKASDAFELGADELRIMTNLHDIRRPRHLGPAVESHPDPTLIDVLLVCANETPDWEKLLPLLARRATIVLMTIQQKPLVIDYMPFILPGHKIIASTEASRQNHLAMIEFADRHKIKPWVVVFPLTENGLEQAFDRLEKGDMRFRGVLEA